MLWPWFFGVNAYLQDHFDLNEDNCRSSGISSGSTAAAQMHLMPIETAWKFGLIWMTCIQKSKWGVMFLTTEM